MKHNFFRRWIATSEIRAAIRREIHEVCIVLNFALLRALEDGSSDHTIRARYFAQGRSLVAVDRAASEQAEIFTAMASSASLLNWNERLQCLTQRSEHPLPFRMIKLLSSLQSGPLRTCTTRHTRKFVMQILARPEVVACLAFYTDDHESKAFERQVREEISRGAKFVPRNVPRKDRSPSPNFLVD